jgi:GntR family transcriptional repressor for pyruvate dehydrogenase complex
VASLKFEHPKKVTIVQSIIDQILAQIRDGGLRPGDKLPSERELIAALSVSRSSVREALQGLAAMNVLESRPGEGTFVKANPHSPLWNHGGGDLSLALEKKMRLDLLQTRWVVDEAIALLAAERASDEDLRAIEACVVEYEQSMQPDLQPHDDHSHLSGGHNDLHMAIARASGNYFLIRVVEMLLDTLPTSLRHPEYNFETQAEREFMLAHEADSHRRLYEAIASRDPARVRAAVGAHMEFARKVIEDDTANRQHSHAESAGAEQPHKH